MRPISLKQVKEPYEQLHRLKRDYLSAFEPWVPRQTCRSTCSTSVLLGASGFTQEEMIGVLDALEQEKFIAYAPGNRLQILKELPEAEC